MKRAMVVLALLFAACNRDDSPTAPNEPGSLNPPFGQTVPFTLVYADRSSGIRAPRAELITQPARWQFVWDEIMSDGRSPKPQIPSVDFDRQQLILAALGESPDACKDIEVESVKLAGDILQVAIRETRPPMSCSCPPVVVEPVDVIAIPRGTTKVSFSRRSETVGNGCN